MSSSAKSDGGGSNMAPRQSRNLSCDESYDVVVIGAGSGGVGAAIGAAKAGARTLVVERYGFAGGAATSSSVLAYCGLYANRPNPMPVVGSVATEVLDELKALGVAADPFRVKKTGNWIVPLNPEALKVALDRILLRAGVSVMYHSAVAAVYREGDRVSQIDVLGHFGIRRIRAKAFVDASGEGDLCFLAGLQFSEPPKIQPGSFPIRISGIDPEKPIDREAFRAAATRYNARAPALPARADGGVVLRMPHSPELWWMALDFPVDPVSASDFSQKEVAARDAAWLLVEGLTKSGPGYAAAYLVSTGPQIGIRESRHPTTRLTISEAHILAGYCPDNTVALGGWPIEIHHAPGVQEYVGVGGEGYFGIPDTSLRTLEIDNVFVAGRLIGADSRAYGSTRVMGTAFATGQAAGVGAALAAADGVWGAMDMRRTLTEQGAHLN
jgi:FAD dependent oxidoreductase